MQAKLVYGFQHEEIFGTCRFYGQNVYRFFIFVCQDTVAGRLTKWIVHPTMLLEKPRIGHSVNVIVSYYWRLYEKA